MRVSTFQKVVRTKVLLQIRSDICPQRKDFARHSCPKHDSKPLSKHVQIWVQTKLSKLWPPKARSANNNFFTKRYRLLDPFWHGKRKRKQRVTAQLVVLINLANAALPGTQPAPRATKAYTFCVSHVLPQIKLFRSHTQDCAVRTIDFAAALSRHLQFGTPANLRLVCPMRLTCGGMVANSNTLKVHDLAVYGK